MVRYASFTRAQKYRATQINARQLCVAMHPCAWWSGNSVQNDTQPLCNNARVSIVSSFLARGIMTLFQLSRYCCALCASDFVRGPAIFRACGLALIPHRRQILIHTAHTMKREMRARCGSPKEQNVNERRVTKCIYAPESPRLSIHPSRYSFKFAIFRVIITFGQALLLRRVYQRQLDLLNYVCDLIKFSPTALEGRERKIGNERKKERLESIFSCSTFVNAEKSFPTNPRDQFYGDYPRYLYGEIGLPPNLHNALHVRLVCNVVTRLDGAKLRLLLFRE